MGAKRRMAALVPVVAVAWLGAPSPALADTGARCDTELWSRPGQSRVIKAVCLNTDRVRLATQPEHGTVTGESFDGWTFQITLRSDDDAPETDHFTLDLDGVDGQTQQTVTVHNIPLSQNHPPECGSITTALRTDGLDRAEVPLTTDCWDEDHDDITVYGGGPGDHIGLPSTIPMGRDQYSPAGWTYRTVVHAGPEQTTMWAEDSQGARSADTPVSLMVGPQVDRPAICHPNPLITNYGEIDYSVFTRAGRTRRFALLCEDDDGDAIDPVVAVPPAGGQLTKFDPGELQGGSWGTERWIDVAYAPDPGRGSDDRFEVLPLGPRGPGRPAPIHLVDRPPSENEGHGCGWSGGATTPGEPVTVIARCNDAEGDPLSGEVVEGPRHGSVDTPTVGPAPYGDEEIAVRYTPDAGFRGRDGITLRVSDEGGQVTDLDFDIAVDDPAPPAPPVQWTPGADAQGWFWSPAAWARAQNPAPAPSTGQQRAAAPAAQARRALGARSVRLVRRLGGAAVYAARGPLALKPRTRALAVTCPTRCRVDAARVTGREARVSAGSGSAIPGRARVVVLRLSTAERRRLRRGRVLIDLAVRQATGGRRTARIALTAAPAPGSR